jgi:hypothetical protein
MPSSIPRDAATAGSPIPLRGGAGGDHLSPTPGAADRFELEPGEKVIASCRFDLDANLRFTDGSILLTDRRLVAVFDSNGLADLAIDGGHGDQDCPADELSACCADHLSRRLPADHNGVGALLWPPVVPWR